MSALKDIFVSVSVIVPSPEEDIESTLRMVRETLSAHYAHYEILVVDSERNSALFTEKMDRLLQELTQIRYIRLFRDVSTKVLFSAGLENAIGDIVVVSLPKFLTPENILRSVELCCEGNDVVCGTWKGARTAAYSAGSWLFRRLFGGMISYDLPKDDVRFRCVSRRIINAAMNMPYFHEFVFLRLANAGGKQQAIELSVAAGNRNNDQLRNSLSEAIIMVVYNTTRPLRIMNGLALFSSFVALMIAGYSVLIRFIKNHVVEGWTTLMFSSSVFFFLMFLMLATIGEYLVQMILTRGSAPSYSVLFERHSSVMLNYNELNIRNDSTSDSINRTQTGRDR